MSIFPNSTTPLTFTSAVVTVLEIMPTRGYILPLVPTKEQEQALLQWCHAARHAYSWAVEEAATEAAKQETYKEECKARRLKRYPKKGTLLEWTQSTPSVILRDAAYGAATAWDRCFKKLGKPPKFRSVKKGLYCHCNEGKTASRSHDAIKLPKIGWVKVRRRLVPTHGKLCAWAIKLVDGKWQATLTVNDHVENPPLRDKGSTVGVDVGAREVAVTSTGQRYNRNLDKIADTERTLKRWQRRAARRKPTPGTKRSNRYKFAQARVAHYYAKLRRQRKDLLHQTSHRILRKGVKTLITEDLNVVGILKNKRVAPTIAKVGLGELKRQLTYKAEWRGIELIEASQWFPSSKICSHCGTKGDPKSYKMWTCVNCGTTHDRDENASKNLADYSNWYYDVEKGGWTSHPRKDSR